MVDKISQIRKFSSLPRTVTKINELELDKDSNLFSGLSEFPIDGIDTSTGMDFNQTRLDVDGFNVPKKLKQKFNIKQYSMNSNTKNIKVTDRDLWEFNAWIKGRSRSKPRLRYRFRSDLDYEDFMVEYQNRPPSIKNDPAILGNKNRPHTSRNTSKKMDDDGDIPVKRVDEASDYSEAETNQLKTLEPMDVMDFVIEVPKIQTDGASESSDESSKDKEDKLRSDKIFGGFGDRIPKDLPDPSLQNLICTLMMSGAYTRLLHLVSYNDHLTHVALEDYFNDISDMVDDLAEGIISKRVLTNFENVVFPGNCPIDYLTRIHKYCSICREDLFGTSELASYQSILDDILNLISKTLYKLKRLSPNRKVFSVKRKGHIKEFSEITSDDEFRSYAHNLMKNAHGDNYSEEVTDKVVNDLLDSEYDNFGELIGRLTSGLGSKTFATWTPDEPDFDEDWIATLIIMVTKDKEKIPFDIFDRTKYRDSGWQINKIIRSSGGKFINGYTRDITKWNLNEIKKFFPKLYHRIQSLGLLKDYQARAKNKR